MHEARKHHYVPVFYQKHFDNEKGLLFVYDRIRQTCLELHPRSICHQSDIYATKPADGRPRDRRLETEVLSSFDGKSASATYWPVVVFELRYIDAFVGEIRQSGLLAR
jgi:Protein of unknown function (DUF4238)